MHLVPIRIRVVEECVWTIGCLVIAELLIAGLYALIVCNNLPGKEGGRGTLGHLHDSLAVRGGLHIHVKSASLILSWLVSVHFVVRAQNGALGLLPVARDTVKEFYLVVPWWNHNPLNSLLDGRRVVGC